jgi:hypothetical protein
MIRRKVMATSIGQMVASTKVAGKMESNMALEPIHLPAERPNKASGRTAKDFTGSPARKVSSDSM